MDNSVCVNSSVASNASMASDSMAKDNTEMVLRETFVTDSIHLDVSSTLKWTIDNFALLSMRHSEIRSPEFEGPKRTRWILVLVLGDPRQRKAEERFVEGQLILTHCPEDAVGFRVRAGHSIFSTDEQFNAAGPADTEDTSATIRQASPNFIYYCWQYPDNLTALFTDRCYVHGALRLTLTVAFDTFGEKEFGNRRQMYPPSLPHFIPDMLFLNDLFFVTAQDERVPAHKAFMREMSNVLKEAIDHMGESTDILLKQFHTPAVTAFVVYCYNGILHEGTVMGYGVEVLKLAHMFNVTGLIDEAADYLLRNVEVEGELRCFKIANDYGAHTGLRKAALQLIAEKYPDILNGTGDCTKEPFCTENFQSELKKQLLSLKSCGSFL
ncbi:hypothetical protein RvY_01326 [Ramazzottius varieornatus]|uniref:BTB domain-containing protein n=1 Tax=Ramazzottius varieornatus TaxID=947166 RepID=A0A1D1UGA5_RAMVA|nr:hypothetical protein RvY_01326 [Ramazzottius varieornatus]